MHQILLANSPKRCGLKQQSGKYASWREVSDDANPPTDTSRGPRPSRFLASSFWLDPHSASDATRRRAPLARSCPPSLHGVHIPDETPGSVDTAARAVKLHVRLADAPSLAAPSSPSA